MGSYTISLTMLLSCRFPKVSVLYVILILKALNLILKVFYIFSCYFNAAPDNKILIILYVLEPLLYGALSYIIKCSIFFSPHLFLFPYLLF